MTPINEKRPRRFQDLFLEDRYLLLKNHLYNYRLRCRAIQKRLKGRHVHRLLEVGSGISPIVTDCPAAVYSDISWTALEQLRRQLGHGAFVVADAACLPFRSGAVSHAISSEVLEHIQWDGEAIRELSRVIEPGGRLLVTFPHRRAYFFNDDRFVAHFRRYEIPEMACLLIGSGLQVEAVEKVLGVLEKILMSLAAWVYSTVNRPPLTASADRRGVGWGTAALFGWINTVVMGIAWLDAKLVPGPMATVVMMDCRRTDADRCRRDPSAWPATGGADAR